MSAPTVLVTLDEVLEHLQLSNSATVDETQVQGFIDAATRYIQNFTGPIIPVTYTNEVHSGGQPLICLFNPPVLSVTSVIEYVGPTAYPLTQAALGDVSGPYAFSLDNPRQGIIRRRFSGNLVGQFAGGSHNISVTYVAGQASVPADIRMAVLQDIAGLFQPSQLGGNPYMNSESGNAPLTPMGMFPRVAEILSAPSMRTPSIA